MIYHLIILFLMFSNLDFIVFMFCSSDLQLAIALQQQEFEQQQPQPSVHPTVASDSGLAADPQVAVLKLSICCALFSYFLELLHKSIVTIVCSLKILPCSK